MESHDNAKPLGGEFSGKMSQERMLSRRRLSNPVVTEPYDDLMPPPQVHTSPADLADFDQINLPLKRLHGSRLAIHQMKAMHIKRFHNLRRSKKSFFCEILLPALFVCLAMIVTLLTPIPLEMPPLEVRNKFAQSRAGCSAQKDQRGPCCRISFVGVKSTACHIWTVDFVDLLALLVKLFYCTNVILLTRVLPKLGLM